MKRIILLFAAFCSISIAVAQDDLPEVKHITTEEFIEKVYDFKTHPDEWVFKGKGKRSCIFMFHATWCPPCRETLPILQLISFDYRDQVDVYQINVDMQYELSKHYNLVNIPTIYFAPKDGSEPEVWIRVPTYEEFVIKIEKDML